MSVSLCGQALLILLWTAGTGSIPPRSQPKPAATVGVTPPHVNAAGRSLLWIAASMAAVDKVRSLLASSGGALLVDLQDKDGASPLHITCQEGHTEVVRALLSAGTAKVDLQDNDGDAPLRMACQEGHTEVVCALLSKGATVDLQTKKGVSPLHRACQGGHTEVVCTLLSAGAMIDLQTATGQTPLGMWRGQNGGGGTCPAISWSQGRPSGQEWCCTPAYGMPERPRRGGMRPALRGGHGRPADHRWPHTPACSVSGRPHEDGVRPAICRSQGRPA